MTLKDTIDQAGGLVTEREASLRMGISHTAVQNYRAMEGFPEPAHEMGRVRLYGWNELAKWWTDFRSGQPPHRLRRGGKSLDDFAAPGR